MAISPADIDSTISYGELVALVDENSEPWTTLAQCDLFLRAAQMLRRREPSETERDGSRVNKRDLNVSIEQCRRVRAVLIWQNHPDIAYRPLDQMR